MLGESRTGVPRSSEDCGLFSGVCSRRDLAALSLLCLKTRNTSMLLGWGLGSSNSLNSVERHHEVRGLTHLDNAIHRRLRGHARNPQLGFPIHYGPAGGVHELLLRCNRAERAPSDLLLDGLHVLLLSETDRETSLARRSLRLSRKRWGRTPKELELTTCG